MNSPAGRALGLALTCRLLCVTVASALAAAALAGPNQLSNASFEAPYTVAVPSWQLTPALTWTVKETGAASGKATLAADLTSGRPPSATATQQVPAYAGATYDLRAQANVLQGEAGTVKLRLEALSPWQGVLARQEASLAGLKPGWQTLHLRLVAPAQTAWLRLTLEVSGPLRVTWDGLNLQLLARPRASRCGPPLSNLRLDRGDSNWALTAWDSQPGAFKLRYRMLAGRKPPWQTLHSRMPYCALLQLTPDTDCEASVEQVWPEYYDGQGRRAGSPWPLSRTELLRWHTGPLKPREWGTLRLWPAAPLTSSETTTHPCLDAYKDRLYLCENRPEGLVLHRVAPGTQQVEQTTVLLSGENRPANLQDIQVYHDRLYILYAGAAARLMLAVYDFEQGKLAGPPQAVSDAPATADAEEGALAVLRDRLWVAHTEPLREAGRTRYQVTLTSWEESGPGEPVKWRPPGEMVLVHPTLAVFEEQLLLLFSERSQDRTSFEPLWALRYDGVTFGSLQRVAALGRNREAQGVQIGSSLYLLYLSTAAYSGSDRLFLDLMLAVIGPRGLQKEATPYVNDWTRCQTPDAVALGTTLWVVYEKLPRADLTGAPADWWGTYLGRIETAAWQ